MSQLFGPKRPSTPRDLALLLLLALVPLFIWILIGFRSYTFADSKQLLSEVALPPLVRGNIVGQTFRARNNYLSGIELLVAKYDSVSESDRSGAELTFSLTELGESEPIHRESIEVDELEHNQPLLISFPPQARSAGQEYYFWIEGDSDNVDASVWATTADAYLQGTRFQGNAPVDGDIYFVSYYEMRPATLLTAPSSLVGSRLPQALLIFFLLIIPGASLALLAARTGRASPTIVLPLAAGFSLGLIALAYLWLSGLGLTVSRSVLMGIYVIGGIAVVWSLRHAAPRIRMLSRQQVGALALLLLILLVRLAQIRDLSVPPGLDSPHHALVTTVIRTTERVPTSLDPLLPIEYFRYHFGAHAVFASISSLLGLSVPTAILLVGQVVGALACLAVFALVLTLTGKYRVAWIGMLLCGLVAPFPGYFLAWGRYTVIAGLLLMPLVFSLLWQAMNKHSWRAAALAALMWAGLGLIHYQLFTLTGIFLFSLAILTSIHLYRRRRLVREAWLQLARITFVTAALIAPWGVYILWSLGIERIGRLLTLSNPRNAADYSLLLDPVFGALVLLALAWLIRRGYGRDWGQALVLWILLSVVAAFLPGLGVWGTFFISHNAIVIVSFVPVVVMAAAAISELLDVLSRSFNDKRLLPAALPLLMLAAAAPFIWRQLPLVQDAADLITDEDRKAMHWIEENVDPGAVFLINGWSTPPDHLITPADAGAWLPMLTGHQVTVPPITYRQGSADYRKQVESLVSHVKAAGSLSPESIRKQLDAAGVTHVYLGAQPGIIQPSALRRDAAFEQIYANGPVSVFVRSSSHLVMDTLGDTEKQSSASDSTVTTVRDTPVESRQDAEHIDATHLLKAAKRVQIPEFPR